MMKITGGRGYQGMCWGKLFNDLPITARCMQEVTLRINIPCHKQVFWTYIIWCQLTQSQAC